MTRGSLGRLVHSLKRLSYQLGAGGSSAPAAVSILTRESSSSTGVNDNESSGTFLYKDLIIERAGGSQMQQKPEPSKLLFGQEFADHMLQIDWSKEEGWGKPRIGPFENISMHPGSKCLHYAIQLFEGLKAFRGVDNKIRLFRPDLNIIRMLRTTRRSALPDFDGNEFLRCLLELVKIDQEWVPYSTKSSLYIRPTHIGNDPHLGVSQSMNSKIFVIASPVGPYFPTGMKPISLYADVNVERAWPGGVGAFKMGSNYAPTIKIGRVANKLNCQAVLWLHGEEEYLTEVGVMNLFMLWIAPDGEKELITAPLTDGLILPGVTRDTILNLAREWDEFRVSERRFTMSDIKKGLEEKRVLEIFGAGTAAVIVPVNNIVHKLRHSEKLDKIYIPTMEHKPSVLKRLYDAINDIYVIHHLDA